MGKSKLCIIKIDHKTSKYTAVIYLIIEIYYKLDIHKMNIVKFK